MRRPALLLLVGLTGCEGFLGGTVALPPTGGGGGTQAVSTGGGAPIPPLTTDWTPPPPDALFTDGALGATPMQRLTRRQLGREVQRVFGLDATAWLDSAPVDSPSTTWFDNDATALSFSLQHVKSYEDFARAVAQAVRSGASIPQLAGCTPARVNDASCFGQFVAKVGRKLLRRTLSPAEVQRHVDAFLPYAVEDHDFGAAVEWVVTAWLQHPEFLYRIEHGAPQPGAATALTDEEIATRLSFLITGQGPDDALLDSASAGELQSEADRLAHALRLLDTDAARTERRTFHAQWLGYADRFLPPQLERDALAESNALVDRVTADDRADWLSLLTASDTFITPALATNYGLPSPGAAAAWVAYPAGRGGGVLSHLTVSSLGSKFGDTSPTLRGVELYHRLLCGQLQGEIPPGLDTSLQPGLPTDCKPKRYVMRDTPGCSQCHGIIDDLGFGLENLGAEGQWRTVETTNPSCSIDGNGDVTGTPFRGPAELGNVLAKDSRVARCATRQLFHSFLGRSATPADVTTLDALAGRYVQTRSYRSVVLALVQSSAFTHKGAP